MQVTGNEVADATVRCLLQIVPAAVPGIAFLSGGQSGELASARLNAMNVRFKSRLPWALSFSFGRALQYPALQIWQGKECNVLAAQQALYHRALCNKAARRGESVGENGPAAILCSEPGARIRCSTLTALSFLALALILAATPSTKALRQHFLEMFARAYYPGQAVGDLVGARELPDPRGRGSAREVGPDLAGPGQVPRGRALLLCRVHAGRGRPSGGQGFGCPRARSGQVGPVGWRQGSCRHDSNSLLG